jgi:NTE family protein
MKTYNAVFEGGGVKGIGLVGAVNALSKAGVKLGSLAGTSAGAIVACLLAAGFEPEELKKILMTTEYLKFKQKNFLDRLGVPGMTVNILLNYGIYSSGYFENWLEKILAQKNVSQFKDIKTNAGNYKFRCIASDITARQLLVLPDDLADFGIDADTFSIAKAVRMSMSIPFFFTPVKLADKNMKIHIIADGGLLSNYPVWLFKDSADETISLRFSNCDGEVKKQNKTGNFADYLKSILETMLEAHDNQHIKFNGNLKRTIFISPVVEIMNKKYVIKTTHFDLSEIEIKKLYSNGVSAGEEFVRRMGL